MKRAVTTGWVLAGWVVAGMAQAVPQFEFQEGTVTAHDGGRVLWENVHDRNHNFRVADRPGYPVGPVLAGGSLYYSVGLTLFEVDPARGTMRRRILLPGPCTALTPEADAVLVEVGSGEGQRKWTRRYRVGRGSSDVPFFLPGMIQGARMARTDAEGVLPGLLEADPKAPRLEPRDAWRGDPAFKPYLDIAVRELERLARWDPTNPWYPYLRGAYLHVLGQQAQASAALRAALALDPAYDFELIELALPLDELAPELAPEAFRRGMTFLLQRGYEPEMSPTALVVVAYLGRPGQLDPKHDLERLERHGERIWEFAPHAEFAAWMYRALANADREAGRSDAAALWDQRAAMVAPYGILFAGPSARHAGIGLNALAAVLIALTLTLLVKALRCASDRRHVRGFARWNAFAGWTRGEIVGFLLVHVALLVAFVAVVRGVTAIGRAAAVPIAAVAGNFGHPEGVEYFARLQGTPAGNFVYALALHKAGQLDAAARIYAQLPYAEAKNNLGVISSAHGNPTQARAQFAQAQAAAPTLAEAAFNLGEPAASPRVKRAHKYGLTGPLLAMPTPRIWTDALAGPLDLWTLPAQALRLSAQQSEQPSGGERISMLAINAVIAVVYLGMTALAILALFVRGEAPVRSKRTFVGWALGFLVPGTARQLGVLGPPLLALGLFSYFVHYAMQLSDGVATDIFAAIAIPDVTRYYGIAEPVYSPVELVLRKTANLWWMLWLANLGAVLVLERLFPDPSGPRAR